MPYRLGELDQRITIKRKALARDGAGGATQSWTTLVTLWALVRPMSGGERNAAMRNEARADYLVVIRWRDDLRAGDRIEWRGRYMNIRFLKNRGPREQFLEIEAEMGATS